MSSGCRAGWIDSSTLRARAYASSSAWQAKGRVVDDCHPACVRQQLHQYFLPLAVELGAAFERHLAYPPASRAAFVQAIFRLALIFFRRLGINPEA
jgi:hypothetical protein